MMEVSPTSLENTPLSVLRNNTREVISSLLNPCKVIPSPSGYPRDFRGLVYLANVPTPPCKSPDPTDTVLKSWQKACKPTVADFIHALEQIDRWDIIDDIKEFIEKDVHDFQQRDSASEKPNVDLNIESDKHILTVDDVQRINEGLEPQIYDAFLLYSDDDADFASEMVERLEQRYQLKLCLKDRDLVGGVTFEHEAIMRLISERCRRLIIIVSPSFIESSANKFFVTYAQALGIEQRQRKIVPCIYRRVTLPPELSYYFVLDHTRSSPLWDFWEKLSQSVKAPIVVANGPSRMSLKTSVSIVELPSPEPLRLKPSEWDCPSKVPAVSNGLLAIEPSSSRPLGAQGSFQLNESPSVSSKVPKEKKKSKLVSLLSGIFPSPPSGKPGKKSKSPKSKAKKLIVQSEST
uniref:Myeloid differentiation primary response protein MyD88 n=1 Tax=Lygus hesperus TaxID=30085 RepID=A0A0A9XHW8_LYGHE